MSVLGSSALVMWADFMRANGARPATVETRVRAVDALVSFAELKDPTAATTTDLIAWLGACKTAWTRWTYWSSAHAWHAWLIDMGLRADDPMAKLHRPRKPSSSPRPAPTWAIHAVLEHPPSRRAYAYVVLAAYAGLRVSEIAKVRGEDVDGGLLYVDGKGGQRASVPVHDTLARLAHGQPARGYWFPGTSDGHVHSPVVGQCVARAMRAAGADVTAHQLRHWFGTMILRTSHDLRVTQELMRHRSPASTAVYTQVASEDKRRAIARLTWAA